MHRQPEATTSQVARANRTKPKGWRGRAKGEGWWARRTACAAARAFGSGQPQAQPSRHRARGRQPGLRCPPSSRRRWAGPAPSTWAQCPDRGRRLPRSLAAPSAHELIADPRQQRLDDGAPPKLGGDCTPATLDRRMWPRTHKAQQRNLLPLVSRARGAVSPPARVPQGYSSAKRAVAGLPERNCATISLLRDQPLSSLMATLRILLASINVLESLRTGRSRLLLGRRRLSLTARLGAPEMAHKRKLQKMQAEEAAASLIDDEPPVRRFSLPPPPLRLARLVRCPPDSARSPAPFVPC